MPREAVIRRTSLRTYLAKVAFFVAAFCLSIKAYAVVPLVEPHLGEPTHIAPLYFGPNAFPIPDMLDGRTQSCLRLELAADGYWSYRASNRTADVFARVLVPLFTDRVNLALWMPVMEWYKQENQSGHGAGDVYISTDIALVKNQIKAPQIALRLAMKTASGGEFSKARHYDCPGYFFDLSLGKSIYVGRDKQQSILIPEEKDVELRISGSAGFLCWQTDNGRQNDAVMYGVQFLVRSRYISLRETFSGYAGWERDGDCPMSIKSQLSGYIRGFEPYVQYQYGIKDYPFHQLRVGLVYNISILKKNKP